MTYRWVSLTGRFVAADEMLTFDRDNTAKGPRFGRALCNQVFGEGSVSAEIKFEGGGIKRKGKKIVEWPIAEFIISYDKTSGDMITVGLGGDQGHMYGLRQWDEKQQKWVTLFAVGDKVNPQPHRSFHVRASLYGSVVTLTVDDVVVGTRPLLFQPPVSQAGIFCAGADKIVFKDFRIEAAPPTAFVVMQYTPQYNELYSDVIKPVCEGKRLKVIRADEIQGPGVIIADIIRKIVESVVVIADITPANPNVYYEVGYAHALKKPTILIADQDAANLPFDVSPFRTLFYENSIGGKKKIEDGLKRYLSSILADVGFSSMAIDYETKHQNQPKE